MPSLRPDALEALIDRYMTGDLDAATAAQLRAYLDATPGRRGVMAGVQAAMRAEHLGHAAPDAAAARRALGARLEAELQRGEGEVRVPVSRGREGDGRGLPGMAFGATRRPAWLGVWSTAAALLVLAAVAVLGVSHRAHKLVSMMTYATGNGERATIMLPDGGTVSLNVASRLEVPADYAAGDRTVRLTGEGLFSVPHRSGRPFTVTAGNATARVLGTTFLVRHYTADTTSVVAVQDGKVAVGKAVLTANRLAEVGHGGIPYVRRADASLFTFATGILTINGVPLSQAIADLDRWYNVDIRLGDSTLATRPLKGEFAAGSVGDLAAILQLTFNIRVVRDGRVLTLYPIPRG